MKIGIIINGFYQPPALMTQVDRLRSRLNEQSEVEVISAASIVGYVTRGGISVKGGLDGAIYLDKDIEAARMLELAGVRLFNRAEAIAACDNKMLTHITLAGKGIASPVTVSSPLCYRGEDDGEFLPKAAEIVGYPMIIKESYGSFGAQVRLAADAVEAKEIRKELLYKPHIYQEFIASSVGRDTRVIVIGGRAIAAMERVNESDFRSNIERGGEGRKIDNLAENYLKIAIKSAEALGLDYAGVDILTGADGEPIVCEVNSNAYFNAVSRVSGIDVAAIYADYVVSELKKR